MTSLLNRVILIFEDNQGAIELSRNPKFRTRTKHILNFEVNLLKV
jgi:hypothetical protein